MNANQRARQLDVPIASATACPRCGKEMRLAQIVPGALGHDLRTFDCQPCGETVTISVLISSA